MKSSGKLVAFGAAWVLGVVTVAGCAAQEVHQHGNSTTVIQQSGGGPATTSVLRSTQGQTITRQDGKSTAVVIQESGGSGPLATPIPRDPIDETRLSRPPVENRWSGLRRGTQETVPMGTTDSAPVSSSTAADDLVGEAMNRMRQQR